MLGGDIMAPFSYLYYYTANDCIYHCFNSFRLATQLLGLNDHTMLHNPTAGPE